ncbi:MAG: ATP-binding protein [Actinobacteria bacterium HGW-Actinobacteria-7]|jgi:serine/threonine-protein kinase RsbW|nr:MAG: ATP-binding protein [Actinobacteria bacterium HGW-Actinobacteria-7]
MSSDQVIVTVPAMGAYAKTLRMTAAVLAARLGMSYDEVEDVRLAAEEAFVYAADTVAEGEPLSFVFTVGSDELGLAVGLGSERLTDEEVERRASYATFILESVCDTFELVSDEFGVGSLRLSKRSECVDGL